MTLLKLGGEGFKLSRTATYMKLLPYSSYSIEERRRVETLPVRYSKAQNDSYNNQEDADLCFAITEDLNVLASTGDSRENPKGGGCFFFTFQMRLAQKNTPPLWGFSRK